MSVDTGVDIVASKDNRLYGIHVKTARLNKYKMYIFDVIEVSFERHNTGSTFYIFVLYNEIKPNYVILPYFEVEKMVHDKAILEVGHGQRYRVNIIIRNSDVYLGSQEHKVNYFQNNWSILK